MLAPIPPLVFATLLQMESVKVPITKQVHDILTDSEEYKVELVHPFSVFLEGKIRGR